MDAKKSDFDCISVLIDRMVSGRMVLTQMLNRRITSLPLARGTYWSLVLPQTLKLHDEVKLLLASPRQAGTVSFIFTQNRLYDFW